MHEQVLARVTGLKDHEIRPGKIDGIIGLELCWSGKNDQWEALITFERGVPVYASWYIWDVSRENMQMHFKEILGDRYVLGKLYGGNGHEEAEIVLA